MANMWRRWFLVLDGGGGVCFARAVKDACCLAG